MTDMGAAHSMEINTSKPALPVFVHYACSTIQYKQCKCQIIKYSSPSFFLYTQFSFPIIYTQPLIVNQFVSLLISLFSINRTREEVF